MGFSLVGALSRLCRLVRGGPKGTFKVAYLFLVTCRLVSIFLKFRLYSSKFCVAFCSRVFGTPRDIRCGFVCCLDKIIKNAFVALFPSTKVFSVHLLKMMGGVVAICLMCELLHERVRMLTVVVKILLIVVSCMNLPVTFCGSLVAYLLCMLTIFCLFGKLEDGGGL